VFDRISRKSSEEEAKMKLSDFLLEIRDWKKIVKESVANSQAL